MTTPDELSSLSKKPRKVKLGTKHQEDENFFNNEIIYYLLTVEQYRSLHIHSKRAHEISISISNISCAKE